RVVRRSLSQEMRSKFDSIDFVQTVWASFFGHSSVTGTFERPEELIAYLTTLARNKVIDEFRRRMQGAKYNIKRERPLEDMNGFGAHAVAARQPSPSDVAIAREMWSQLVCAQPAHYQRMIQLRFEGASYVEIASELGVNERTVRRV